MPTEEPSVAGFTNTGYLNLLSVARVGLQGFGYTIVIPAGGSAPRFAFS